MKQTFLIEINRELAFTDKRADYYDFFRVGCKRVETAKRYLKGWVKQAKEKGCEFLYKGFFMEGATYIITATPDGYHKEYIAASGKIADLLN